MYLFLPFLIEDAAALFELVHVEYPTGGEKRVFPPISLALYWDPPWNH